MHAEELRRFLAEKTGRPVRLRIHDNLRSMLTARRDGTGPGLVLSVHRMFLRADADTLEALARFASGPTPAVRARIRDYINRNLHQPDAVIHRPPRRQAVGTPQGRHRELATRAERLNGEYFAGVLDFRIAWSTTRRRFARQYGVTLGTWNLRQRLIRIHPMLDNPYVPELFLDFVVYHEMAHVAVPSEPGGNGRIQHHTRAFRAMERRFAGYRWALAWEERWIAHLIAEWNGTGTLPAEALDRP